MREARTTTSGSSRDLQASGRRSSVWLPVLAGLGGLLAAVLASMGLARLERWQLQLAAETASRGVAGEIRSRMDSQVLALTILARRLERAPGLSRADWEAEASLLADQDSVQAIEWVDPQFRVRWVVPLLGNEEAEGLDLGSEPRRREALVEARDTRKARFSRWIDLVQGGKGFLVQVPIHRADGFGGFVVGVYRIESLLNHVLANVSPAHGVSVSALGERAWSRHSASEDDSPEGVAHASLGLHGVDWGIKVWSPSDVREQHVSFAPLVTFAIGVLLSALITVALHQAQSARHRSAQLTLEMVERRRAEDELMKAHVELEDRVATRTAELVAANARLREEILEREHAEETARERQDELAQVLRRVTMGEMASGLAHELTQPLSAIANYAEACAIRLGSGDVEGAQVERVLEEITTHTMRAGEVIHRLRQLLRKREAQRAELPVAELVDQAVRLAMPEALTQGVGLATEVGDDGLLVDADPIQIEQVLLNLLRNSFDALSQAGTSAPCVRLAVAAAPDERVQIQVSDNGPGLSEESVQRLFEPFFTTKERGLGMGLSISRSIVEAHGGRLRLVRDGAVGAAFRFDLPGVSRAACHG